MANSLRGEFQKFLFRGNVVDLSVAVVIGAAFNKIVTAFVSDLIMPLVSVVLPEGGWRTFKWTPIAGMDLAIGDLIATLIDFVIVAFVLFLVLVKFVGFLHRREQAATPPVVTKTCGECLETVPTAAKRCKFCTSPLGVVALFFVLAAFAAHPAQAAEPAFNFTKAEAAVKKAEWKAQAKGGLLVVGGNARATTGTFSTDLSYKRDLNRVSLDGGIAYVRTSTREFITTVDGAGNKISSGTERVSRTTSRQAAVKGRYDRFLTEHNSAYVSAQTMTDEPAGKEFSGGGQGGYSRQLLANQTHTLVAELGYDFSYEKSVAPGSDGVPIHSGRAFVADSIRLSPVTGISAGVELLTNLNDENEPKPGYAAIHGDLGPLNDTRVNGKAELTTTLRKNVGFGFGFSFRYDARPSLIAPPGGVTLVAILPRADRLDTRVEANLIVSFF